MEEECKKNKFLQLEFYKNDEEMCKTINSTLKRINLYNTNIFGKLDIYSTIINERNIGSVSVSFPEACWMKTKKEIYDFAFNLQEIMTENHKEKSQQKKIS